MISILAGVGFFVKDKLCKHLRRCRVAGVRLRYLMIINLLNHRSARQTAEVLGVHNTTVYRVARRFRTHGEWALWDGREDNGETKLDEHYLEVLQRVVRGTPTGYGWRRPSWTRGPDDCSRLRENARPARCSSRCWITCCSVIPKRR